MTTDRYLRFEYRADHWSSWQHWSDEPASQLIEELREASEGGRYRVRALDADGTVVAELNPPEFSPAMLRNARCDLLLGYLMLRDLTTLLPEGDSKRREAAAVVELMRDTYEELTAL